MILNNQITNLTNLPNLPNLPDYLNWIIFTLSQKSFIYHR